MGEEISSLWSDRQQGARNMDNISILNILASNGVEFLLSGQEKVPLSSCFGKTICLFFSAGWCRPCRTFTPQLSNIYETLKKRGEKLEIIFVSIDHDQDGFEQHLKTMKWLAVPFNKELQKLLSDKYRVNRIPSLVLLCLEESDEEDLICLIEDYGAEAFPFTKKRIEELQAVDNTKREGGKLEELLGHQGRNYVLSKDGGEMPVSELVGKTIGLYFAGYWSPPSRSFTAKLAEAYKEMKSNFAEDKTFEIVFVSTDRNIKEFELNSSDMPWLVLPYEDKTRQDLYRIFNIRGIPVLLIIGEDGKVITANGKSMVSLYGAKAFPFTEARIRELEASLQKKGEGLPSQVKDIKHEHELKLEMTKAYVCDSCKNHGKFWAFSCNFCNYDLHPSCVEQNYESKT